MLLHSIPVAGFNWHQRCWKKIGQLSPNNPLRYCRNKQLTEEEMRQALFGDAEVSSQVRTSGLQVDRSGFGIVPSAKVVTKKRMSKALNTRLRVILQVGDEFEGETSEIIHEADTLSTLLAEQEAIRIARKKFRYVAVISINSVQF